MPSMDCRLHTCSASSSTLEPAASATISKRSGCSATMSSVCVPMLPVLPSSEKRCGQGAPPVRFLMQIEEPLPDGGNGLQNLLSYPQ